MDEIERELRETLSERRLSLPVRPDAVALLEAGVRRRRRNRAVATVSAAVVLLAGGVTAASLAAGRGTGSERIVPPVGGGSRTPAVKPTLPAPTVDEVPWAATGYDFLQPPVFPGTAADLSVPWCRASQLSLAQQFHGAGGSWVGTVTVTNQSSTACAVQGQPAVSMVATDGHTLLTSRPEPFYVDAWVRIAPGESAGAQVIWAPQFCHVVPVGTVTVQLPHSGGAVTTSMTGNPRCDVDTARPFVGHLDVDGFVRTEGAPFTPLAGLQAHLDKADLSVAPGETVDYRLHLQSMDAPRLALNPCLPYRERLVDHATRRVLIEEDHLLNCGEAPAEITDPQSNHDTFFDLELVVPPTAPAGDYDLLWQSVLKPVAAIDEELVHVTQPVPACGDGQVSASAGDRGAAGGSYYDVIMFRNISTTTCSLFGYPGVKLADASGHAVRTDTQRGGTTGHLIVLAPGAAASATISGGDSGPDGGATPCKPTAGVLVIAPGQHLQTLVRGTGMRCYDSVTVWPVVAGSRGSLNS